jgi:hypothetical protein
MDIAMVLPSRLLIRGVSFLAVVILTFQNIQNHVRLHQETVAESVGTVKASSLSADPRATVDETISFLPPVKSAPREFQPRSTRTNKTESKDTNVSSSNHSPGPSFLRNHSTVLKDRSEQQEEVTRHEDDNPSKDDLRTQPNNITIPTSPSLLLRLDKGSNDTTTKPANTSALIMDNQASLRNFTKYDRVVIATKIHGPHQWSLLEQSLCLLHHAYNHRVLYDMIVFSTIAVPLEDIQSLQQLVSPANVTIVVDNQGLQKEIAALSEDDYQSFLLRCNVSSPENLTWFSNCPDRIAYNWQAEFRGLRLWHHPSLDKYSTMLWMDADGFATKPWENDPVEFFIKNDAVVMFDHFPQAFSSRSIQPRVFKAFGASVCKLGVDNVTGSLVSTLHYSNPCKRRHIPNIHGFFHITNLDFFRTPKVTKALQELFKGYFLSRFPDDQLVVTAVAAIFAPERSWEMRSKGFHLDVFHNHKLDGIDQAMPAGFLKYFPTKVRHSLPSADGVCPIKAAN